MCPRGGVGSQTVHAHCQNIGRYPGQLVTHYFVQNVLWKRRQEQGEEGEGKWRNRDGSGGERMEEEEVKKGEESGGGGGEEK